MTADEVTTERLDLRRPSSDDLDELFAIDSDPRVWTHYPSARVTDRSRSLATIGHWLQGWRDNGLDTWIARLRGESAVIGYGGCSARRGGVWNLGYRFVPEVQGRGLATELSAEAVRRAGAADPARPVVAHMLEHNPASERVAIKVGLMLVHRGPDAGNPDHTAVRLVYCDRPLTTSQALDALR